MKIPKHIIGKKINEQFLKNMYISSERVRNEEIMIHGGMIYECGDCGKQWRMWLEAGVEGPGGYETGQRLMPCPFITRCACGGMAKHIDWHKDVRFPEPRPLSFAGDNASYFKLDRKGLKEKRTNVCGIAVVNPDSPDLRKL